MVGLPPANNTFPQVLNSLQAFLHCILDSIFMLSYEGANPLGRKGGAERE